MSFLYNWFFKTLNYLGLQNKEATILFLGLDNAGKTTLLHMLRDNKLQNHEPTRYANNEDLVMEGVQFHTYDLGGHLAARRIWKDYCVKVHGIVFLVDAADKERFSESRKELAQLLSSNELKDVPFLILGNKIDKKEAVNEKDLRQELGLQQTTGKNAKPDKETRAIEVYMCSVTRRLGFADGFQWLAKYID